MRTYFLLLGLLAIIPLASSLTIESGIELTHGNVTYTFTQPVTVNNFSLGSNYLKLDTDNISFRPGAHDLNITIEAWVDDGAKTMYMTGEASITTFLIKDSGVVSSILMNGIFYNSPFTSPATSTQWTYYNNYNLTVVFRKESTGAKLSGTTVRLDLYDNAYTSLVNYTTTTGSKALTNLAMSQYIMKYYATGYETRYHDFDYSTYTGGNITLYLLNSSLADNTTFTFRDADSALTLEGVNLVVTKYVNGTMTTVQDSQSNVLGKISLSYTPSTYYCFTATKTTYTAKSWCLDEITETEYSILLGKSSVTISDLLGGGNIIIRSINHSVTNTSAYEQVLFYANDHNLAAYQLNITYNGTTTSVNGSSVTGSTLLATINTTGSTSGDKVYITASIRTSDDKTKTVRWTRTISTGRGLEAWRLENTSLDPKWAAVIATIIIMLVAGLLGAAGSLAGSTGIGASLGAIMASGVFAYLNWIPDYSFYLIALIGGLYIATRIGGGN